MAGDDGRVMTRPRQSVRSVPLTALVAHPANIRKKLGDLTELAASIREHGLLQPLIVTEHPTDYEKLLIVAGHRRAAAAKMAGLPSVPVVVRHGLDYDPAEQTIVMLVENCQRSDLGPIEKAEALGTLRDKGLTLDELARRTGMSRSSVSHHLSLLILTDETRQAVRNGHVTVGAAVTAIKQVRRDDRDRHGHARPGPKAVIEPAHFTRAHPLAAAAAAGCAHSYRPKVGGVACGVCWETAIRMDAVTQREEAS